MPASKQFSRILIGLFLACALAGTATADGKVGGLKGDSFDVPLPPPRPHEFAPKSDTKPSMSAGCRLGLCYPDFPVPPRPVKFISRR